NLIFGAVIDPKIGDDIRITVIATGFDRAGVASRMLRKRSARVNASETKMNARNSATKNAELQPANFNPEDLDIPTFLRKRVGKE
ncbi:MAG: cell division protein FtsZ, partial [Chloroflexota bacterium]